MPLEILNGQSTADFYINNPDMMAKEIKLLPTRHHKDNMINGFLKKVDKTGRMRDSLIANDWLRQKGEPCRDIFGHNLLLKAFLDDAVTVSRILVSHFITLNKSVSTHRIIMNLVPRILRHDDPFEDFGDFFIALKPDSIGTDNPPTALTYALHQKAFILP